MDFSLSPQEEAFKKELDDWLDKNLAEMRQRRGRQPMNADMESDEAQEFTRWWHKKLHDAGYIGIAWPKEYGGRGATIMEQVIFNEEMAKRRAPPGVGGLGVGWAGPTIMAAGSEEQKKRFLPKILGGDEVWCQAFSEPEAGSDLANSQTRAVEDGDDYVVNGQKVWTTGGMRADWAILLAKTDFDPNTPRHRSFSYFLMDMHAPGVTVRPLREMTGNAAFGETFLDNVRIPKNLMVGPKNGGWYISMGTLEFERSNSSSAIQSLNTITSLIELAQKTERNGHPLSKDPLTRQKIAQFYIESNVGKYIGLRALTRQLRGQTPGPESSVGSLLAMELGQRIEDFAMYLEGPYSQLVRGSKHAINNGMWQRSFLASRGRTIMTGTSEIKRNIIAQRTLGLPRYTT
ncbi:MAG TPA: acyl-CoA dehydrogenase family protein [Dehalococcoidales bacterium]|nr:acyl-CoA dehydrogenase family protein [Dehalococcoidales bacterium]